MNTLTEADVEQDTLDLVSDLGWQVELRPDIGPDGPSAGREDFGQVFS